MQRIEGLCPKEAGKVRFCGTRRPAAPPAAHPPPRPPTVGGAAEGSRGHSASRKRSRVAAAEAQCLSKSLQEGRGRGSTPHAGLMAQGARRANPNGGASRVRHCP